MKEKDILKSRDGFTLIEVIVVLIILSILAVVVAVKYVDITSDSQQTAVDTVLFDAAARYNMAYAKYMLLNPDKPTGLTGHTLNGGTIPVTIDDDFVDFTVTWSDISADDPDPDPEVTIKVTEGPSWLSDLSDDDKKKKFPFHPSN